MILAHNPKASKVEGAMEISHLILEMQCRNHRYGVSGQKRAGRGTRKMTWQVSRISQSGV
jgi:hypothetical protein